MSEYGENRGSRTVGLPRVINQFIGVGRQLQVYRRNRRLIDLQKRSVENRVLHLQKQESKAKRMLQKKKEELDKALSIRQRKEYQSEEKQKVRQIKLQQLARLKQQNQYMRMIHKTNLSNNQSLISNLKHSDYSTVRQQRLDGQFKKNVNRNSDLREKKDHWVSMNIEKQRGKLRVDQFFKNKNKQSYLEYQSRIKNQSNKIAQKTNTIKQLSVKQERLKFKLEQAELQNSRMQELIKGVSRVNSPLDTNTIENQLYMSKTKKKSKARINNSHQTISFTDRQSTTIMNNDDNDQEIEETIEKAQDNEEQNAKQFKLLRRKRKNKHINRYKQYEAF